MRRLSMPIYLSDVFLVFSAGSSLKLYINVSQHYVAIFHA